MRQRYYVCSADADAALVQVYVNAADVGVQLPVDAAAALPLLKEAQWRSLNIDAAYALMELKCCCC